MHVHLVFITKYRREVFTKAMQGVFKSNVASNPQGPADLQQHPGDITDEDPIYVFAVGASFSPSAVGDSRGGKLADALPTLCTLTLASFTLSA